MTDDAFEGAAEGGFRIVAEATGNGRHAHAFMCNPVARLEHLYARDILGWRIADRIGNFSTKLEREAPMTLASSATDHSRSG